MFDRDDCRTCEIDDGPTNESHTSPPGSIAARLKPQALLQQRSGRPAEVHIVQSAFSLQPEEACLVIACYIGQRVRRVRVADRDIALFPERVVRQIVFLQISIDVPVVPVGNRVDLPSLAG